MNQQTYWISWRKGISLSATFLLTLIIATSCKKDPSTIGAGVLDPEALLASGGTDTFDLETRTDTNLLSTENPGYLLLGSYTDPKFGLFEASFYTELRPAATIQFNNLDNLVVDSVVLSLGYKDYYGVLNPQTFSVQQLTDKLPADEDYYATTTRPTTGVELVLPSSQTQTPNVSDSVMIGAVKQPAQLRLHLDPTLGLNLITAAFDQTYTNGDQFEDYFKGLRVSVTNSGGTNSILYFYPTDATTRLTVFYKQNGTPNQVAYKIDASNCTAFNHTNIQHSPDIIASYDYSPAASTRFYAQSFGTRATVKIPELDDIPHNSIIHNALLVLPIESQTLSPYYPSSVIAFGYNEIVNGDSTFHAVPIQYDFDNKRYVADISDFVQRVVADNWENTELYFYPFTSITTPSGSIATAERIIFSGPATTNKFKPKLIVKYTEY